MGFSCANVLTPLDLKAQCTPNVVVPYGKGEFQFGVENVYMAPFNISKGAGRDDTRFVNTGYRSSAKGCCWQANDGVEMHDLTMESRVGLGEQSQTFGFQGNYDPNGPACPNDALAKLYRCRVIGHTFALYMWGGLRNTIIAYDTEIIAGKWGCAAAGGSGPTAQFMYLFNCDVIIDYDKYPSAGGDQGNNAIGVLARGGVLKMYGGTLTIKGSKNADRAYGAWSTSIPGPPWLYIWPLIELHDVTCRVDPNGAKDWCDVCGDVGTTRVFGGTGSGPGGKWVTKGNVSVF